MNLLRRQLICERLKLKTRQSYRIVGSSRSGLISSDEVLRILNQSRRGIQEPYSFVPSDLMKAEELLVIPELAESGLTTGKLRAWTHRTKNIPPHFRLNGHTIRYPRSLFIAWLAKNSKVVRRS